MNNLEIFRISTNKFLQSQQISSIQRWRQLLDNLCDLKILSPKQIKLLNQSAAKRSFPIGVDQFEQMIMKQFGDEKTKNLIKDIQQIQKQIKQAKGVLAVWKEQGLSKSQIRALEVLFAKGNRKMKQICDILHNKKELLQSISQPQIQMIKSMNQWTQMQKIKKEYKDYEQYQQINSKAIDNLYAQLRVREVHFRNKKVPKQQSIHSVIGFNSKTDQQIEVTKIPKKMNDFDQINTALVTFNAQRDLMLSPYFVRFLGYSTNADPNYYFYFREFIETKNLQALIKNSSIKLQQNYPIFKFWVGQIFRAFRDMYYQCSYEPVLPVRIKDIQVGDYGLRVLFKHIRFYKSREFANNIEPELLENVGKIILELLNITEKEVESRVKSIQNRSLIHTLLKARKGLQKFEEKIVPCCIGFHNAQTHPLFESVGESQGLEIIDNFTILFGDQL